jgi:hypothetical protein
MGCVQPLINGVLPSINAVLTVIMEWLIDCELPFINAVLTVIME